MADDKGTVRVAVVPSGPWTVTRVSDVPTLQRMLQECHDNHHAFAKKAIDRLRKARAQRDIARAESARLRGELELWERTARAMKNDRTNIARWAAS